MNKITVFIFLLLANANLFSQNNQIEKENIIIIIEQTKNPIMSNYVITEQGVSKLLEKEFEYKPIYGEYEKKSKPFGNREFEYDSIGFVKVDLWSKSVSYGKKGEQLNKPWLKYKYDELGNINEISEYSNLSGKLENRFRIFYNSQNQIDKIIKYRGESKKSESITNYTYENHNRKSMLTYKESTNDKLPKPQIFKAIWSYDENNRLISYKSYQNRYGFSISKYKYVNGKEIEKTLKENLKEQEEYWTDDKFYEYFYSDDGKLWTTRKEYKPKRGSITDKEYLKVIERIYE